MQDTSVTGNYIGRIHTYPVRKYLHEVCVWCQRPQYVCDSAANDCRDFMEVYA